MIYSAKGRYSRGRGNSQRDLIQYQHMGSFCLLRFIYIWSAEISHPDGTGVRNDKLKVGFVFVAGVLVGTERARRLSLRLTCSPLQMGFIFDHGRHDRQVPKGWHSQMSVLPDECSDTSPADGIENVFYTISICPIV